MSGIPIYSSSDDSSEPSLAASEGEDSFHLSKSDKALLFDLVLAEKFSKTLSTQRSEYRCRHSCHLCGNQTKTETQLSSASNFQRHENDFSFDNLKRKLIIESVVHDHFKQEWKVQKERLLEVKRRLKTIMDKYSAQSSKEPSKLKAETGCSKENMKQIEDKNSQKQMGTCSSLSNVLGSSKNTGPVQLQDQGKVKKPLSTFAKLRKSLNSNSSHSDESNLDGTIVALSSDNNDITIDQQKAVEVTKRPLQDNDSDSHVRLVHDSRESSIDNSTGLEKKIQEILPQNVSCSPVFNLDRCKLRQEIQQLKRALNKDQDCGTAEKRRKIVDTVPSKLRKSQVSNVSQESHQRAMNELYGPIKSFSYTRNVIRINSSRLRYKRHVIKAGNGCIGRTALAPTLRGRTDERRSNLQFTFSPPLYTTSRLLAEYKSREPIKPTGMPQNVPNSFETKTMNLLSSPMNIDNGIFYIDRQYVDLALYWNGLRREGWNPTQCVYEICSSMYWGAPTYRLVDYVPLEGFIFDLTVKERTFLPKKRVTKRKEAKHVASIEFLKYLGFDLDYKEESRPFNDTPYHNYDDRYQRPRCPW